MNADLVSTMAGFMTDDVRLRLGNAELIQGRAAFVGAVNSFLASVAGVRHEIVSVFRDADEAIVGMSSDDEILRR